jgi:hypothetical protein
MSRVEFLNTLSQYHVSPFALTAEELEHDMDIFVVRHNTRVLRSDRLDYRHR